jgi:hypothetical protein
MQVLDCSTQPYRTVLPVLFEHEESVLQEWLSKQVWTGDIVLDTAYFQRGDVQDMAWRNTVTADEFDSFCASHVPVWARVAQAGGFSAIDRASTAVWSPRSARTQGIDLSIQVITLLNDMMRTTSDPASFTWDQFALAHSDGKLTRYCKGFAATATTIPKSASKHFSRELTSFGSHVHALWQHIVRDLPSHSSPAVYLVAPRPADTGSMLTLDIEGVAERVEVPFPPTQDAPGELCLLSVPCSRLSLMETNLTVATAATLRPPATPSSVSEFSLCIPCLPDISCHVLISFAGRPLWKGIGSPCAGLRTA